MADLLSNPWPAAGVVLMACLVAYLAFRNNKKNRRANACADFRAAISAALVGLYPEPSDWPSNIDSHLRQAFPALQTAVTRFRPFVPWYRRRGFDRAWLRYRSAYERKVDVQCYHHYIAYDDQPDPKATLRRNVSALLSYADDI